MSTPVVAGASAMVSTQVRGALASSWNRTMSSHMDVNEENSTAQSCVQSQQLPPCEKSIKVRSPSSSCRLNTSNPLESSRTAVEFPLLDPFLSKYSRLVTHM